MKLLKFTTLLDEAQEKMGIPGMREDYEKWGDDVKKYAEIVWPEISRWTLIHTATWIYIDTFPCSPIEIKLYFALKKQFMEYFMNWPDQTALLTRKKIKDISDFLKSKGQQPVYTEGDINYEIDLFIYIGTFQIQGPGNVWLNYPIFFGIECDGHNYHEKTKEQAQKDRQKERFLKKGELDIIRFTGSEITYYPDRCAEEVYDLIMANYNKTAKIIEGCFNNTTK